MLIDVVLDRVKTNIGTYLVNGSSESDVRSLMVMKLISRNLISARAILY